MLATNAGIESMEGRSLVFMVMVLGNGVSSMMISSAIGGMNSGDGKFRMGGSVPGCCLMEGGHESSSARK